MCGGGFGAGLLAVAIRPLCKTFAWRGTLVITSALFAQTLLGIALFRPFCTHQAIIAAQRDHVRTNVIRHESENTSLETDKKLSFFQKPLSRRSGLKRGSIMTKIIEEKNRQRTTSTGSLDGMVITRENEVIALSSSEAYESVAAAAAVYAASHPVQDCEHTAPLTSCTEKGIDEPTENKIRCTHIAGFSGRTALQTLQEEPCTSFSSNQHSCTAVLPPPVRFNRHAVLRIAKAIIHKLQTSKVLPQNLSSIIDAGRSRCVMSNFRLSDGGRIGPYSNVETSQNPVSVNDQKSRPHDLVEIEGQAFHNHIFGRIAGLNFPPRLNTSVGSRCPPYNMPSEALSSPRLSGVDSPPTSSRLASSVSLDTFINGLVVRELHALPLDDQTKASVLTALRFELTRPKRRADLFYRVVRKSGLEGSTRLSSKADDAFASGCSIFYVTYKTGFGTIRRVPHHSPGYNEPSNNRPSGSVPLSKQTVVRWETTPHFSPEAGINFESQNNMTDVQSYLFSMLNVNILKSVTFLLLLLACSINMLVLLVPYYYLPLLLELGGSECSVNKQWCPNGLPHHANLQPNWLRHIVRWTAGDDSATFFVSPGSVLLTIGFANVVGRILAALYMERDENARYKLFKQCPLVKDPLFLNILSLLLCGLSLACFPLSIHGLVMSTPHQDYNQPEHVQAWSTEFRLILFYFSSIVYGVASAIALSLRSVILVELFGIRRLTNAFGYLLIFQGVSVACGPPLFGYFCDPACHGQLISGSHSEVPSDIKSSRSFACANRLCTAFYICAALFLLTGLLFIPLRWFANREPFGFCCPSASGAAVPSSFSPKESNLEENASSCFPPFNPDFSAGDTQETQTTVLESRTDSGN
ncbi:unnamed protein product [Dicrocoelium dendriticum]|nr:unnamed protein product [Dicrocoelium dendriticum]